MEERNNYGMWKNRTERLGRNFKSGECRQLMKAVLLTEAVIAAVFLCVGHFVPRFWPVLFLAEGILFPGLTAAGFFWIDRRVERTMRQVDDTIAGLLEKRACCFSSNEDSLLGKFQSQIYRVYDILRSYEEEEKRLRTELNASLSNLVHQLNTPITNLMIYSGFLTREDLGEEERIAFARRIRQQAEKLSWLGEGFSRLSRLETGVISLHPACGSILPPLLRAMQQAEPKAEANGSTLQFEGDDRLCAWLDEKWMEEAFYNILDNAVKYGRQGGTVTVRTSSGELYVRIDICNEGDPIPAEEYPLIFGRFGRGRGTEEKEGVGLGLYLAREVVKRQGGYIRAGYDRKRGETVFSVFLRKELDGEKD